MLDFRAQSVIMEKQFHNRQFGIILSLNKTTETTSMKTMVFIEGAVPRCTRTKPGRDICAPDGARQGMVYRFGVHLIFLQKKGENRWS